MAIILVSVASESICSDTDGEVHPIHHRAGRQKDTIDMALCTRCGQQTEAEAEFCPACGGYAADGYGGSPTLASAVAAAAGPAQHTSAAGPARDYPLAGGYAPVRYAPPDGYPPAPRADGYLDGGQVPDGDSATGGALPPATLAAATGRLDTSSQRPTRILASSGTRRQRPPGAIGHRRPTGTPTMTAGRSGPTRPRPRSRPPNPSPGPPSPANPSPGPPSRPAYPSPGRPSRPAYPSPGPPSRPPNRQLCSMHRARSGSTRRTPRRRSRGPGTPRRPA